VLQNDDNPIASRITMHALPTKGLSRSTWLSSELTRF